MRLFLNITFVVFCFVVQERVISSFTTPYFFLEFEKEEKSIFCKHPLFSPHNDSMYTTYRSQLLQAKFCCLFRDKKSSTKMRYQIYESTKLNDDSSDKLGDIYWIPPRKYLQNWKLDCVIIICGALSLRYRRHYRRFLKKPHIFNFLRKCATIKAHRRILQR